MKNFGSEQIGSGAESVDALRQEVEAAIKASIENGSADFKIRPHDSFKISELPLEDLEMWRSIATGRLTEEEFEAYRDQVRIAEEVGARKEGRGSRAIFVAWLGNLMSEKQLRELEAEFGQQDKEPE